MPTSLFNTPPLAAPHARGVVSKAAPRTGQWSACVLALCSGTALAQAPLTPPDAGTLRQQVERDALPTLPAQAKPLMPAESGALTLPQGTSVNVRAFRFAGNTLLSAEQLAPAVQAFVGRALGFNELNQATQAVAQRYRDAGWVVRAYLPRQDVTEGAITIQVVEAMFGGARLEGPDTRRRQFAQVLQHIEAQQAVGAPLNADALDRALLLADDLPGVTVAGALEAGQQSGQTDLVLKLIDEPWVVGEVGLDNAGSRATGPQRISVNATMASPLLGSSVGRGDLVGLSYQHTRGSDYLRVGYSLPLGADGWRVGLNASRLDYQIIAPEFVAPTNLEAAGESTSLGLDATYPLLRSRQRNVYLNLAFDRKGFDNRTVTGTSSRYSTQALTLALSGNLFDALGGGGANSASLALVQGRVALGALDANEKADLQGSFNKLRYSLSRQQVITQQWSLLGAVNGQLSSQSLDSSERFHLGGPSGVRAYPVSEGSGSRGTVANVELRWRLPQGWVLTGFHDWGHVSDSSANAPRYSLKGSGLSVNWAHGLGLNLKATWARRLGNNPNPTATGKDQDGSLQRDRLWLSATQPF